MLKSLDGNLLLTPIDGLLIFFIGAKNKRCRCQNDRLSSSQTRTIGICWSRLASLQFFERIKNT